jgi:hypothetical protein
MERSLVMRRFKRYVDGLGKPTEPPWPSGCPLPHKHDEDCLNCNKHSHVPIRSRNKATLEKPRIKVLGNYSSERRSGM